MVAAITILFSCLSVCLGRDEGILLLLTGWWDVGGVVSVVGVACNDLSLWLSC